MFEMMAGSRPQGRTLEFFGLLSLPRKADRKPNDKRPNLAENRPHLAVVLNGKQLKPR